MPQAFGGLEREQEASPYLQGVLDRFQARRVRLPLGVAEVVVPRARRQHEHVVVEGAAVQEQALVLGIDAGGLGEQDLDVLLTSQDRAQGRGDVRG